MKEIGFVVVRNKKTKAVSILKDVVSNGGKEFFLDGNLVCFPSHFEVLFFSEDIDSAIEKLKQVRMRK